MSVSVERLYTFTGKGKINRQILDDMNLYFSYCKFSYKMQEPVQCTEKDFMQTVIFSLFSFIM